MVSKNIIVSSHFEPQHFGNGWGIFVDIENSQLENNNRFISNTRRKQPIKHIYNNFNINNDFDDDWKSNKFVYFDYHRKYDIESQTHLNNFDYFNDVNSLNNVNNFNNVNNENNENDENTVYEMLGYLTTTLITSCLTYSILCIL